MTPSTWLATIPTTIPIAGPPKHSTTAACTVSPAVKLSSCSTSRLKIEYNTMATPSFNKLSPSIKMDKLSATPNVLRMATTATCVWMGVLCEPGSI